MNADSAEAMVDTDSVSAENVEIVRQIFRAWAKRDRGLGMDYLDAAVEWDSTQSKWLPELSGIFRGRDALRDYWRTFFELLSDVAWTVENVIDAGEDVIAQFIAKGRGRQSGAPFERRLVNVYTLRDGRVIRLRVFDTVADAAAAVGI